VLKYIRARFSNYENLLHCDLQKSRWARLLMCCYLVFKDRLTPRLPSEVFRALCRGELFILVNFEVVVNLKVILFSLVSNLWRVTFGRSGCAFFPVLNNERQST